MPILPGENRSVLESLEQAENIPTGLLQGVYEKRTGWRPNLNFLPDYMLPEKDRGENKTEQEVMAQDLTGAKMLRMNLDMFGGNESLASHAFNFGPEQTQKRLQEGKFPQEEVDTVFDIAKRKAGILGQQVTPQDIDQFTTMLGSKPSQKVIDQKQPPRPTPQQPVSLKRREDGTYYTGNPLYDDFLQSENISASENPEADFLNLKRKLRGYEQAFTKAGIPINKDTLRLAHDKGVGTAIKTWNGATSVPEQLTMGADVPQPTQIEPQPQPVMDDTPFENEAVAQPVESEAQGVPVTVSDEDWSDIADRVFGGKKKSYANKTVNKAIGALISGIV